MAGKTTKKEKPEGEEKKKELTPEEQFNKKMEELETKFGKGSIYYGQETGAELESISTGSLAFDMITRGGHKLGKLIEIFGPESSGKSTLTLHAIANFQNIGRCALIDYESSYDRSYAKKLGVKVDKLILVQPSTMEDGYNLMNELILTGKMSLLVMDSHTAAIPKMRLDALVGETKMAPEARTNSEGLKKLKPLLMPNNCSVIGISQLRADIGGYGEANKPTGGNAWRFYTDIRYKVYKELKREDEYNKTTIEVVKSKCYPPHGKATFNINWGTGIDKLQEIIDIAVEYKLLTKGGAGWYTIGDTKIQGDNAIKEFLNDNENFRDTLEVKVLEALKNS